MPEIARGTQEFTPDKAIASAMREWLKAEIDSSGAGRNAVLDDFYNARKYFTLRSDDPANKNTLKNDGHYNRLKIWTPQFAENSMHDYLTARQLFCAQMYLSGMFRSECFVTSRGEEEYRFRRFGGHGIGIDLEKRTVDRLASNKPVELDELIGRTDEANEQTNAIIRELHNRNRRAGTLFNYIKFINSRDDWLQALSLLQETWLDVSIDYITYAAEVRGNDLSKVPFLEPKSISDNPQIYYPFN
jgi:hypothetical protein